MALDRFLTKSWVTSSISGSGSSVESLLIDAAWSHYDIHKLKITPSAGGGNSLYQIYYAAAATGSKAYNSQSNAQSPYVDPIDIDADGNTTEEGVGWAIPYTDDDGTGKLHVKIYNYAGSARTYTVEIWYEYAPKWGSSGGVTLPQNATVTGTLGVNKASGLGAQVHIVSSAAGTVGLRVDTAASASAAAQSWTYNGAGAAALLQTASTQYFALGERDLGNDVIGAGIYNARNTNAAVGTVGPSAGIFGQQMASGAWRYEWVDATGKLRIHTARPTGSSGAPTVSDTAGVVVGDQTSWYSLKQNITKRTRTDYEAALQKVLNTDLYSYDMDGQHREFGLVIYEKDVGSWYSQNDDLSKDQTPTLDERQIVGVLVASIKALHEEICELRGSGTQLAQNGGKS